MNNPTVEDLLIVRPALIIGDRATSAEADRCALLSDAFFSAKEAGMEVSPDLREAPQRFFDSLRAWRPQVAVSIESTYRRGLTKLAPTLDVKHLAAIQWSAVVSLALSNSFEQAVQTKLDSSATTRTQTLISHPATGISPRTLPIFRLMGDPSSLQQANKLAISASDYAIRKQCWGDLLTQFVDCAKSAIVVVLGIRETDAQLEDCLATMLTLRGAIPNKFYFLEYPSGPTNPTLLGMLAGSCLLYTSPSPRD